MIHNKGIIIILALSASLSTHSIKEYGLSDLETLASHYNEDIKPLADDFYDPDFSSYFLEQRPSYIKKLLQHIGFFADLFSIDDMVTMLENVVAQQKSRNRSGDFIIATEIKRDDSLIIFGSIDGAFHSLVRDIRELVRKGIVDESLTITNKKYRIIFNGTAVARSPYALQTLFTIALLMNKNPDSVFYMRNDFEKNDLWKERAFIRQIQIIYKEKEGAICKAFTDFITITPRAFYSNYHSQEHELLKITALEEELRSHSQQCTGYFFYTLRHGDIATWNLNNKNRLEQPLFVTALIDGTEPRIHKPYKEELILDEPINVATVWRSYSGQLRSYTNTPSYKTDAFINIIAGTSLDSTIIQLISHNQIDQEMFSTKKSFALTTGIDRLATEENLNSSYEHILIGSTLDISKSNYIMSDRICGGMGLALQASNNVKKTDNYHTVKICLFDDEYTPALARQNIDFLRNNFGITTLLLPIGTPTVLAAEDLIFSGSILVAFPVTGTPVLRRPEARGAIHFRPSFETEVQVLLSHLINQSKYKKFAFFFQDDEYGQGCMKKARQILKENDIETWVELPYGRNTTHFNKQVALISESNIEALGCFSSSLATQNFLRQVGVQTLASTKLFALAFVVDEVFESFVKHELGLTGLFSRVTPNPWLSSYQIVQEYRTIMKQSKKRYDAFSLEGYIATSILCDTINTITGTVSHTSLIEQLESLKNYTYKGLVLTFNPLDRQISNRVWLDFQDGNDWVEVHT